MRHWSLSAATRSALKLAGYSVTSRISLRSTLRFQRGRPARPRLVVIWITPLAAAVPYRAAAAGPLRISTFSMSSGLMSLSREGLCQVEMLVKLSVRVARTPSITRSGSLESDTLFAPRMRMRCAVPAVPLFCVTDTPGERPWRRLVAVGTDAISTSCALMVPMAFPSSRCRCSRPEAVTTRPPISSAEEARVKSAVAVAPAATVTVWTRVSYPMRVALTCTEPVRTPGMR